VLFSLLDKKNRDLVNLTAKPGNHIWKNATGKDSKALIETKEPRSTR